MLSRAGENLGLALCCGLLLFLVFLVLVFSLKNNNYIENIFP